MTARVAMGRTGTLLAGVTVLATATLLGGCHTYRTVDEPTPGSTVRVRVPVSSALSRANRSPETAAVEGQLLSAGDTLVLAVQTRQLFGVHREIIQYDTFRVASDQTSAVDVREFSPGRSIVLGTALAAVATGAAAVAFGWGGGGDNPDAPGGGGPETSIVATPSLISSLWGLIVR